MRLFFAGDLALKSSIEIDKRLSELIKSADIACVNLEGPLSFDNAQEYKHLKRGSHILNVASAGGTIKQCGINLVTLANNHIMDYGIVGLKHTLDTLDSINIKYIGAGKTADEIYKYYSFVNYDNSKLAIINIAQREFGCSPNGYSPGYAWFNSDYAKRMIKKAVEECDFVIVVAHMGAEEWDIPLPEVRSVYKGFIDEGVGLVIGHHPHVIQGREKYKGRDIFYSLGNFAFDGDSDEGLAVEIDLEERGQIVESNIYQIKYRNNTITIEDSIDIFNVRSNMLLEKNNLEYEKKVDEYSIRDYLDFERKYYALAMGINCDNPDSMKKFIEHRVKGDPLNYDDIFLWHNIAIESHRWVCIRAIEAMGCLSRMN